MSTRENDSLSRRGLLGAAARVAGGVALAGAGLGTGKTAYGASRRIQGAQKATTLKMLAWYGHAEPDVVREFERKHNVKFVPKYYTGGDNMLALIAQSPPGTYDIILSDAEYITALNQGGYVEPLDPTDYPFEDYLLPIYRKFPGLWLGGKMYGLMARFGYLGVAYRKDKITKKQASTYDVFWSPRLKGKVAHFDWYLPNLGELSLKNGNRKPYELSEAKWNQLKDTVTSLRPQVKGFFDYGGTFSSLKNGQVHAVVGIGDWVTGALERDGAPVGTVIPREGGIQWTEAYAIGKGSEKADLARRYLQYLMSPPGQVRLATMKAYPSLIPTRSGWKLLNRRFPKEARRQGMVLGKANAITQYTEGKIHLRQLPVKQSVEDWNDFWSEYKAA